MMKKVLFFIIVLSLVINFSVIVMSADSEDIYADIKDEFEDTAKEYDQLHLNDNSYDELTRTQIIFQKIYNYLFSEIKGTLLMLFSLLAISVIISLASVFVTKEKLFEVIQFSCISMCASIVIYNFKEISHISFQSIRDLSDFMDVTVPTYATVLASSGFDTTAITLQSVFVIISVFITHFVEKFICPVLFLTGILSVTTSFSSSADMTKFIKLISKSVKYILGITTTIFAGILAFTGFTSSAGDNIGLRTAKYAIANFVPVVGGCLSEALNGVVHSSLIVKNSIGYIGFLTLLSLCMIPVAKIYVAVFSFRLSASAAELFAQTKLGSMLDTVCEVLVTLGSMVIFITVIFVLLIGVISSVGI